MSLTPLTAFNDDHEAMQPVEVETQGQARRDPSGQIQAEQAAQARNLEEWNR
jgi:hypothetical protein